MSGAIAIHLTSVCPTYSLRKLLTQKRIPLQTKHRRPDRSSALIFILLHIGTKSILKVPPLLKILKRLSHIPDIRFACAGTFTVNSECLYMHATDIHLEKAVTCHYNLLSKPTPIP